MSRTVRAIHDSLRDDIGDLVTRRPLPGPRVPQIDPFLFLNHHGPQTYAPNNQGLPFGPHPHRGFETVTYMLDGRMQHRDNRGNTGDLGPGDVQWMTAARGIIHSEMPQQTQGRMRGFQLWLNLPARKKMKPAAYRDIAAGEIPVAEAGAGVRVRVIAGRFEHDGVVTDGAVRTAETDAHYFDVHLDAHAVLEAPLPREHNVFLYAYEGEAFGGASRSPLSQRTGAALSAGDVVRVEAGAEGARLLIIAGRPLGEPVVQHGPFVMNTREEIAQAIADYQAGTF